MSKTRFTQWIVLACMGALAACTSGEGGPVGNTEMNVVVPNGAPSLGGGSSAPALIDIQSVEYTINCLGNDDTFLENNASFPDEVRIEGNLEVVDDRTNPGANPPDFGPLLPGDQSEVWQAFMDLPPGPCTVQLRARDNDGEVICTATESFNITADTTTKVNLILVCDVSFQAPVGMLDVDATFSFVVSNFCPDLFVLNCLDSEPAEVFNPSLGFGIAATSCEVRFRDGDSSCGNSCDPQVCSVTPEGLDCAGPPAPGPGVSTTVTCTGGQIDCDFNPLTTETECTFSGDTLGNTPVGGPIVPNTPGDGAFAAGCIPPALGGTPGAVIVCTAVTTDGDTDCDKTKVVSVTCPGLTPCDQYAADGFVCDDGNSCTADACDNAGAVGGSCGAADNGSCCTATNLPAGDSCTDAPPPAVCDGAGNCNSLDCNAQTDPDGSCDDSNECTIDSCDAPPATTCTNDAAAADGNSCNAGSGTCAGGACVDNCAATSCDDGNECTDDACDPTGQGGATCSDNGPCCSNTPDDTNACTSCPGIGGVSCECNAGLCEDGVLCPPNAAAPGSSANPIIGQAQTSCRNSFNQLLSQFPVDYSIVLDDCAFANQQVNADVTPTLNFEASFLQVAADTLCTFGIDICADGADFTDVQVRVASTATTPGSDPSVDPAVGTDQGASCTTVISELSPVPQSLALTCSANCPAPVVTAPVAIPLPTASITCDVGAGTDATGPDASSVAICATGSTPLLGDAAGAPTGTQDVNTWAEVSIGFPNPVSFQCGDATVSAADPCTSDATCPAATSGDAPFAAGSCDVGAGTCVTQTIASDPQVDCAQIPVE